MRSHFGRRLALILLIPIGCMASPAAAVSGPWIEQGPARLRLISRWAALPAGAESGLGLEFQLAPGWHVYWKNAGDAGYPPQLEFEPGALVDPRLLYPAPHRFDLPGGLVAFGYEVEVVYPIEARRAPEARDVVARIDYLVCASSCVPYQSRLSLSLPVGAVAQEDPELAARLDPWRARVPTAPPLGIEAKLLPGNGPELTLELFFPDRDLRPQAPDLFFETHPLLVLERPEPFESAVGPGFRVRLRPVDETKPLPERLELAWTLVGYETGSVPIAWQGRIALDRPGAQLPRGAATGLGLAVVLAGIIWTFLHRARRATRR